MPKPFACGFCDDKPRYRILSEIADEQGTLPRLGQFCDDHIAGGLEETLAKNNMHSVIVRMVLR